MVALELTTRFERGHEFWTVSHSSLDERVDKVESVLDQQRGARNLVYALIGTNALLAIATGLLIVAFFFPH